MLNKLESTYKNEINHTKLQIDMLQKKINHFTEVMLLYNLIVQ